MQGRTTLIIAHRFSTVQEADRIIVLENGTIAEEGTQDGKLGIWVRYTYDDKTPNEKSRGQISGVFSEYPKKFGKGEWVAKTIEDAKQMAIDFNRGVS